MRRERLFLADIVDAADAVAGFVAGRSKESFLNDDLLRSAVLHKLTIIGEAAARLPRAFREAHPNVPWADIVAFRNIAVHSYFAVDWMIVWTTAIEEAPELRRQIASLFSRPGPSAADHP
jgi:uncharacterized protein with HEPN domain